MGGREVCQNGTPKGLPDTGTECDPAGVGKPTELMRSRSSFGYDYGPFGEVSRLGAS